MTREEWLNAFINAARPRFRDAGAPLPKKIRASIGFSSKGKRAKTIGECWSDTCSKDGAFEIFIVPQIEAPLRIADILTHELIHAAHPGDGHGRKFGRTARALGLQGKLTATVGGPEWEAWAIPLVRSIGKYPGAALSTGVSTAPKKQTTRMVKCECTDCGFLFRTTRTWIESAEQLNCPSCSGDVQVGG